MGGYFAGEEMMGFLCLAWGSALRASYFLLLRQKKVSKEKATPGSVPGCARFLALLGRPGGCATRLRLRQRQPTAPGAPALLGASQGARKSTRARTVGLHFCAFLRSTARSQVVVRRLSPDAFPGPMRGAEQRRNAGGSGGHCLSRRRVRQRPPFRVAQGTGEAGRLARGRLFFGYFLLAKQKKVRPPARRNPKPITKQK